MAIESLEAMEQRGATPAATGQQVELAHVHTMRDEIDADMVRSALNAAGIKTFRTSNEGSGTYSRSPQIDIVVTARDANQACDVLDAMGIERQVLPMNDPYSHILAVNEGMEGRLLRHRVVKWFAIAWVAMALGVGLWHVVLEVASWFGR